MNGSSLQEIEQICVHLLNIGHTPTQGVYFFFKHKAEFDAATAWIRGISVNAGKPDEHGVITMHYGMFTFFYVNLEPQFLQKSIFRDGTAQ